MRYDITHTTDYEYDHEVSVSHHLLHLAPRSLPHQRCLSHELSVDPTPAVVNHHVDYFGNQTAFLTLHTSHRRLRIVARSLVEVDSVAAPDPATALAWEKARDQCGIDPFALTGEFVFDSPLIKPLAQYAEFAAPSFPAGRPCLEAVIDLTRRIHGEFKFDPDATTLATSLEQVFTQRRGVCQDFAHFEIAALRSIGLAARYVSGYIETIPPPGKARLVGADASHAWVACYCPPFGWVDVDPTNNLLPSGRHITLAWGRDYSDISPVRGVLVGSGGHSSKVAVDVLPIPRGAAAAPALSGAKF